MTFFNPDKPDVVLLTEAIEISCDGACACDCDPLADDVPFSTLPEMEDEEVARILAIHDDVDTDSPTEDYDDEWNFDTSDKFRGRELNFED